MDIAALSNESFNAIDWINGSYNKHLKEIGNEIDKKGPTESNDNDFIAKDFIAKNVSKLHLYIQQVHNAVEETSQKVVSGMPRVVKDALELQTEVEELKKRMHAMRREMTNVQEETGDCMAALERLNTIQTKLQKAKESLQESDGWGNLICELEDCFEHNNLKGAFDKLLSLQKSLQVQEQLVGHAERLAQVEDFKNRLEAVASPNVVQCFSEGSVEHTKQYVSIFSGIQRVAQLEQYYRAVQKNSLQQKWKQILDMQAAESSNQTHFLSVFYNYLLEHCHQQVKWCAQVFHNMQGNIQPVIVIIELLPSLQPSRDSYILQLLKACNERLELLEEYAQANHTFMAHLTAFLEQSKIELSYETHCQLLQSVYGYFHKFIEQYPRIEETQLSTQVDKLLVSQTSAVDSVRHLDNCNQKMFDWLSDACERCSHITDDLGLCRLIEIICGILKKMLENFSKTQRQISLSIDNGTENWSTLQCSMSLLQCLADFQIKLQKFEKSLQIRMSKLKENLISTSSCKISVYKTYDIQEQKKLISNIEKYQKKNMESSSAYASSSIFFTFIYDQIKIHCVETHEIALNVLLKPIEGHLLSIQPSLNPSSDSLMPANMPEFSFAPQECITQIGQYLLTLPQHLEPLLFTPSPLLKQGLEICNVKYTQAVPCADILLSLVVEQCCQVYQSQLLQIKSLSAISSKQFAVDIEYLSSVVEDLGLSISANLSQILILLKAAPENYLALSAGCEPRLVTAIRQMRNIVSTQ
ncbi:conserved oligomeric Golgi complex subunit 7 [Rhagoletis pomonella]|uniref:conserved oligomeric Golgi complex subunit 7 n=1 Tax=Rhagoletis pomonella TaxID=28610 RepID=UPI00177ED822|nr:conserved oligomeric Golgi complex subunit 7 [Rhagoletis pomonella]